jgi:hypothetical protein
MYCTQRHETGNTAIETTIEFGPRESKVQASGLQASGLREEPNIGVGPRMRMENGFRTGREEKGWKSADTECMTHVNRLDSVYSTGSDPC